MHMSVRVCPHVWKRNEKLGEEGEILRGFRSTTKTVWKRKDNISNGTNECESWK